jgi:muramoyltetrapeptide carboxypeptidase
VSILTRPPDLRPGDAVAVVAPAGVPAPAALAAGVETLAGRYDVRLRRDLAAARFGMHAGTDAERADELRWALSDPDIRAVIAARGGWGTARILDAAVPELRRLAATPRWVVGFSDLTALVAAVGAVAGLQAIHGDMVCQLGRRGKGAFERLAALLEGGARPPETALRPLVAGRAAGPLAGGNLTVLSHLVGTPWMPNLRGAVLFVEDVGERPYRVDRCLVHLRQARCLDGVAGLVFGDFTGCEPEGGEASIEEVIERFATTLGVPAAAGLRAGHGADNHPLLCGAAVTLDAAAGHLVWT